MPETKGITELILANLSAAISLIALIATVIITIYNHVWFNLKRRNEREYHFDFVLCEILILEPYKQLMTMPEVARKELIGLFSGLNSGGKTKKALRAEIEKSNRNWDTAKENAVSRAIPLMQAYSAAVSQKSVKILEDYFDSVTEILCNLDGLDLTSSMQGHVTRKLEEKSRAFVNDLYAVIRETCPIKT